MRVVPEGTSFFTTKYDAIGAALDIITAQLDDIQVKREVMEKRVEELGEMIKESN